MSILPSQRVSRDFLRRRRGAEGISEPHFLQRLHKRFPLELMAPQIMGLLGVRKKASEEFLSFAIETIYWNFPTIPSGLKGFRILHLSDLHADLDEAFAPTLSKMIRQEIGRLQPNICVITGDFQNREGDTPENTVAAMHKILAPVHCPIYAVPGNHDSIATLDAVAETKMRILINEVVEVGFNGETLYLCGIDDAHKYKTHDLNAVNGSGFRVLLSHSPEVYREASMLNFALCLSGHTHAGQIRLFNKAIFRNADIPDDMVDGTWKYGEMRGYTSRGTGSCTVPLRLNCLPEISLHVLG